MIIFIWLDIRFSWRTVDFGLLSFFIASSSKILVSFGLNLTLSLLCQMIFHFIRYNGCELLTGSFIVFLSLGLSFIFDFRIILVTFLMMIYAIFIHLLFAVSTYLSWTNIMTYHDSMLKFNCLVVLMQYSKIRQ